jgi:lysozyme
VMDRMMRRELIKSHEGLRLRKYRCSRGHWTIGWGWNLDAHPLPAEIASFYRIHGAITEEMAERLLDISMAAAEADCRNIYPGFDQFSERRKDALVDFVFNLGAAGALKFRRMRAAIIAGDWLEAARQLNDSAYWRQLGGDPAGTDDGKLERPEELYRMLVEG